MTANPDRCANCNENRMVGDTLCVDCRYDENKERAVDCPTCGATCMRDEIEGGMAVAAAICSCGWTEDFLSAERATAE